MSEEIVKQTEKYKESDDFVPNPIDAYGTLDTSGTAGTAHSRLEEISPVFDVAKKADLIAAGRALDASDTDVPSSLVILPEGDSDPEAARKRVENAAAAAAKEPVVLGGDTVAQKEAQETGEEGALDAQSQQEQQEESAGSAVTGDADKRDDAKKSARGK